MVMVSTLLDVELLLLALELLLQAPASRHRTTKATTSRWRVRITIPPAIGSLIG
jgi:hypothetical protein